MSTPPSPRLPSPRFLARALLGWAWGSEADAVAGDVAESLAARRARGASTARVWLRGWWEVAAAVIHGRRAPALDQDRRRGRGGPGLRPMLSIRLAVRGLSRDLPTSLTAVCVLALGMAAAATFFAILSGLTRPLPVPDGRRVVRVQVVQPARDGRPVDVTGADLVAWRGVPALAAVGGSRRFPATLRDPGRRVTRVAAAALTPGALALLAIDPVEGRIPVGADAEGAVLLGAGLAQELSADDDTPLLGRVVEIDGRPGVVAAVMPEEFGFPVRHSVWVVERPENHLDAPFEPVARLAPGAGVDLAAEQLQGRWAGRDPERGTDDVGGVVRVKPYTADRGESGELFLFVGLVLVGVALLVIACANVANLLLVRATERVRVLGVQAALGASRLQLGFQLLAEALLLAAAGGAAGLALASVLAGWVEATMGPENFGYYWIRIAVDGPVVGFTAALVLGTGLLAGTLPLVRVLGRDLNPVLRSGGTVAGGGRIGRVFVGMQLALSCAALVAAGLTVRSMAAARDFGRGVPAREVLLASIDLPAEEGGASTVDLDRLREATRDVPGARSVVLALGAPGYGEPGGRVELDGVEADAGGPASEFTLANAVDPGFFDLFDLELRAGRLLGPADGPGDPVAVVNDAFARRFWPGSSALGRTVRMTTVTGDAWARVVGVVETADLGDGPQLREDRIYVPLGAVPVSSIRILARAADGDGGSLAGPLRRTLAAALPDGPVSDVRTLAGGHAYMTRAQGTFSTLAAAGGGAGLLVAVVGLYGLLAFRVRQRRRELGVRKALGADGATLAREVFAVAARQLAPAVAGGLALAWIAAPLLGAILLGGDPRSPLVFAAVGAVFAGAGLSAAVLPAVRAGRVEPASVLRAE